MKNGIVGIIPVKGNSERISRKNIRPFHDTNLLELKLKQVKDVAGLNEILVSSEDDYVLDLAKAAGVSTHKRNPYYSTSSVPMSEVYSHLASEVNWDTIAWINVTNPLVETPIYEKAVFEYKNMPANYDGLISVAEVKEYIIYNGKPVNFQSYPWPRSQDLKGMCAITFAISILPREVLEKRGTLVGDNPYLFYIDPVMSTDIDFQENFDFCELLYKKKVTSAYDKK